MVSLMHMLYQRMVVRKEISTVAKTKNMKYSKNVQKIFARLTYLK